jgi:hypothetical protein
MKMRSTSKEWQRGMVEGGWVWGLPEVFVGLHFLLFERK